MRVAGVLVAAVGMAACGNGADVGSRSAAQTGPQPGPSAWTERTMPLRDGGADPNPTARRNAAMAYDQARGVAVLYGGIIDGAEPESVFDETWEWSSASRTWSKVAPTL